MGLKELKELISSYQGIREDERRGPAIVNSIDSTAWIILVLLMTQLNVVMTLWAKSMLRLCTF